MLFSLGDWVFVVHVEMYKVFVYICIVIHNNIDIYMYIYLYIHIRAGLNVTLCPCAQLHFCLFLHVCLAVYGNGQVGEKFLEHLEPLSRSF